jgi:hypothetical protein
MNVEEINFCRVGDVVRRGKSIYGVVRVTTSPGLMNEVTIQRICAFTYLYVAAPPFKFAGIIREGRVLTTSNCKHYRLLRGIHESSDERLLRVRAERALDETEHPPGSALDRLKKYRAAKRENK